MIRFRYKSALLLLVLLSANALGQHAQRQTEQVRAYYESAQKFEAAGDWQQAEQTWRAVLKLTNNDARAWTNLGVVLNRQEKTDEALEAWKQAISLDPKLPGAYFNIGRSHARKKRRLRRRRHSTPTSTRAGIK